MDSRGKLTITVKHGDVVTIGENIIIGFERRTSSQLKMLILAPRSIEIKRANAKGNKVQDAGTKGARQA